MGELADIELSYSYPAAEFGEAVLAEVRAGGHPEAQFERFGLVLTLGAGQRLLLDRLYLQLQQLPDAGRAAHIRAGLAAALRPLPADWADVRPLLRSVLRPASYTAAVTDDDNRPWIRPLWPFVHELAVLDTGDARSVVMQRDTAQWGVGGEQMFAAARGNIAARYPPQSQPQRVGHLRGDGRSYCDSAALAPGWLSSFDAGAGTRPLVFFPGDEVLLVCTDGPEVAPEFFAAAERLYRQAAVPISPQGYTIVGETIVAADAAGPTPARALAVRARSVLAEGEYLVQTERLQRFFAGHGRDTQAAALHMVETPRGSCTMTVWRQRVPWLLPAADYVTLMPEDRVGHFTVPFPVAADILGLLPDPGLVPLRFGAPDWPTPDELAVLRAHSVQLPGI